MEHTVKTSTIFKQGTGAKGPWTIYKLTLENDPQEPTGFDPVQPGDKVTLTTQQVEKDGRTFQNLNYSKVDTPAAAPQAAAPSGSASGDARVVKLLVVIAETVGADKDRVLDILSGGTGA